MAPRFVGIGPPHSHLHDRALAAVSNAEEAMSGQATGLPATAGLPAAGPDNWDQQIELATICDLQPQSGVDVAVNQELTVISLAMPRQVWWQTGVKNTFDSNFAGVDWVLYDRLVSMSDEEARALYDSLDPEAMSSSESDGQADGCAGETSPSPTRRRSSVPRRPAPSTGAAASSSSDIQPLDPPDGWTTIEAEVGPGPGPEPCDAAAAPTAGGGEAGVDWALYDRLVSMWDKAFYDQGFFYVREDISRRSRRSCSTE